MEVPASYTVGKASTCIDFMIYVEALSIRCAYILSYKDDENIFYKILDSSVHQAL